MPSKSSLSVVWSFQALLRRLLNWLCEGLTNLGKSSCTFSSHPLKLLARAFWYNPPLPPLAVVLLLRPEPLSRPLLQTARHDDDKVLDFRIIEVRREHVRPAFAAE